MAAAGRPATTGVLERSERRKCLDDTALLRATIATFKIRKDGVTEYIIRVQRGASSEDSWQVMHRYSDFANLATALQHSGIPLNLPPKKVFKSSDRQFITERQQGLEVFLQTVLSEPILSSHIEVKHFLDPSNYSLDIYEKSYRNVSMFFRSEPSWTVASNEEKLKGMGGRIRKQYYLITDKDRKLPLHLLTVCEPGPDNTMGAKEMEACLKVLTEISHPFILSPVLTNYSANGVMIVREFVSSGSLKDAIYSCPPRRDYLAKYSQPARTITMAAPRIKQYGRQILEALNFLADKGFVMGHVHSGNILLKGDTCKLVDIENTLLGLPSIYRQFLVEIKKLRSHVGETVYSFGHVLYEMCAGRPLKTPLMGSDTCPRGFQPDAARIIESILTAKAIKDGLPSLPDLLKDPFFSEAYGAPASGEKPRLRVPSKLKEVLHSHLEKMEQRLLSDQKRLAQQRRLSKAQESVQSVSEDEKKKRRKIRKKQLSMQEEDGLEAYPTTTSLPRQNTVSGDLVSSRKQGAATNSTPHTTATNGTTSPSIASGSSHNSNSSNSKNTPSKTKTPPTSRAPPPSAAPANGQDTKPPAAGDDRLALLGSIAGFTKGKLKKTVTNDRSGALL